MTRDPAPRASLVATAVVVVVLAALLPFLGALACDFVLDDVALVRDNPLIRDVAGIPRLFSENYWAPHDQLNLYRPLTVASFAVNRALLGPEPRGFHAVNLVLHALTSVLLLAVALRLGTGLPGAFVAALLFATHPLHTEPIVEIVGRAEILAAGFALAALWAHAGARSAFAGAVAALALLAALLAKEVAIGVLPAMLALDLASGRCSARDRGRDYALLALAVIAYFALRMRALGAARMISPDAIASLDNPLVGAPLATRLMTAGALLARYLGLTLWPDQLSADYSYAAIPRAQSWLPHGAVGVVVAAAALWLCLRACRRGRAPIATAAALFLGSYFVISNTAVLIGTIFAERLFYLPSAGLALLLAASVPRGRVAGAAVMIAALATSLAFAARATSRTHDFKDERTLLAKTVVTSPRSVRARIFYAYLLLREGDVGGARDQVQAAMKIDSELGITWVAAARVLGTADIPGAIKALQRALTLDPALVEARVSLAAIYVYTGRHQLALPELERVLERRPNMVEARISLTEALLGLGRTDDAEREVRHLTASRPDLAMSHFLDGLVRAARGEEDAAIAAFRRALAIEPGHAGAIEELRRSSTPPKPPLLQGEGGLPHPPTPSP